RARFEIFDRVLVAGIVGYDELKARRRFDQLAGLLDREHAAIVGQRMDDDDGILPRLDDLVEIADGAEPRRGGERPVDPHRLFTTNEEAPGEVARREVVVAGDGDERAVELPRHMFDEPRLSAAGRALEHDRQATLVAACEDVDLVAEREIVRFGGELANALLEAEIGAGGRRLRALNVRFDGHCAWAAGRCSTPDKMLPSRG